MVCSRVNFYIGFYLNSSSLENGGIPYNYALCSPQVFSWQLKNVNGSSLFSGKHSISFIIWKGLDPILLPFICNNMVWPHTLSEVFSPFQKGLEVLNWLHCTNFYHFSLNKRCHCHIFLSHIRWSFFSFISIISEKNEIRSFGMGWWWWWLWLC